jgi:hypothetical protein
MRRFGSSIANSAGKQPADRLRCFGSGVRAYRAWPIDGNFRISNLQVE